MIRQPDFVTKELFRSAVESVRMKKKRLPVDLANFEVLADGSCVQMMHHDSYDNLLKHFSIMEKYCEENGLTRLDKRHKEIYRVP